MAATSPPFTIAAGAMVRCLSAEGLPAGDPLHQGHVYQVRGVAELADAGPSAGAGTAVYLHGLTRGYAPWRFGPAFAGNDNPAPAPASCLAQLMARVMRETVAAQGSCDVHDLARAGFTMAQIIEYADEARGLAGPLTGGEAA